MYKMLLAFVLCTISIAYASQERNDSLYFEEELKKIDKLSRTDPDSVVPFAKKLEEEMKTFKLPLVIHCKFNIKLGNHYRRTGNIPVGLSKYFVALDFAEESGNKKYIAFSMGSIALVYSETGRYEEAIVTYIKNFGLWKEMRDTSLMTRACNNIATSYLRLNNYPKTLEYGRKAVQYAIASNYKGGYTHACMNIAEAFYYSIEYSNENYKSPLDSALKYAKESFKVAKKINHNVNVHQGAILMGMVYNKMGKTDKALEYCQSALELTQNTKHLTGIMNACNCLSEAFEAQGNHIKALEYFKKAVKLDKEMFNDQKTLEIARNEMNYNFNRQQMADSLKNEAEKQRLMIEKEQEVKQQKILMYAGLGGFVLMLLAALLGYKNYKQKQQSSLILEEKNREITDSITYAKRIQNSILPPQGMFKIYLKDTFIYYQPKDIVAGDFYWMDVLGENVIFAAADCTGHGVPGALVSVVCNGALNSAVKENGLTEPSIILNKVSELVAEQFATGEDQISDGMDIALVNLNTKTRELKFAGANNPVWVVTEENYSTFTPSVSNEKYSLHQIKGDKQPIGKFVQSEKFTNHTIQLKEGDLIYLFSDGFADQFGGANGKKFKYRPLKELILSICQLPMEEQKNILHKEFINWMGDNEQVDDVCIIGVRV